MTVDTILGEVEHISGWMGDADPSREFDYSRDSTGTHDGVETFKTRAAAIPEGVRRAF